MEMSRPEIQTETRTQMLGELMRSEKDLSRVALIFRSVIASRFGLNVTDAECMDYLMDTGPTTAGKLAETISMDAILSGRLIEKLLKVRQEGARLDGQVTAHRHHRPGGDGGQAPFRQYAHQR